MTEYSQAFLDKHRYWNVDDSNWWEHISESWKEKLKERGIEMTKLYFSGFWSPGNGACFDGQISNLAEFIQAHQLATKLPLLAESKNNFCDTSWGQSGHYVHKYSIHFSHTDATYKDALEGVYDLVELMGVGKPIADKCNAEIEMLSDIVEKIVRDYCTEIYCDLEKTYMYLTSDEAVVEALRANDVVEMET